LPLVLVGHFPVADTSGNHVQKQIPVGNDKSKTQLVILLGPIDWMQSKPTPRQRVAHGCSAIS
jgi:hypothetical protein